MSAVLEAVRFTDVDEGTVEVGARIRERRERLGWTVTRLAEEAGVDRSRLSRLENGKLDQVRRATIGAIEATLDKAEQMGLDNPVVIAGEGQYVKFGIGDAYVEGTVKSPEDREALEDSFRRLMGMWFRSQGGEGFLDDRNDSP